MRSWFWGLKPAAYGSSTGALPTPAALIAWPGNPFCAHPSSHPGRPANPLPSCGWISCDQAGQTLFDFTSVTMNNRNPKSRLKYFKILPPDFSNPQSSCTLVMFSPGEN
ncbi:MAG: hypothetical protein MUO67_21655, partial [Anaerolineales bacterium]|nr:hypothetical protein [Anaerolineales bacterium]